MQVRLTTAIVFLVGITLLAVLWTAGQSVDAQGPGTTSRVSVASNGPQGNGVSETPSISSDGRYITFASSASNLIGIDTDHDHK